MNIISEKDPKLLDFKLKFKAESSIIEGQLRLQLEKYGFYEEGIPQDGIAEELQSNLSGFHTNFDMAEINLETVMKIVPIFDGKYKELDSLLKIVEILCSSLTIIAKSLLIDFITNVKLSPTGYRYPYLIS